MNRIIVSMLIMYFSTASTVTVLATNLVNNVHFLTCVSKHGGEDRGCSINRNCCSSFSALVKDVNYNCQHSPAVLSRIIIELKSDLSLNNTVHFENDCCKSLSYQIRGNNFVINCFNHNGQMGIKDSGSGLYFKTINGLSLTDITFSNCGSMQSSTSRNVSDPNHTTYLFSTTLYLLNCSNVDIINVTIIEGHGTGAALFNNIGNVSIVNCTFKDNWVRLRRSLSPGGGGLYIEFTDCMPGIGGNCLQHNSSSSQYIVHNCFFTNNKASFTSKEKTSYIKHFLGLGKGGGMAVYFNGNSMYHNIHVLNCFFHNNSAVFGGGMSVEYWNHSKGNHLTVESCNFTNNHINGAEGAGVNGGFVFTSPNSDAVVKDNKINFTNCLFQENIANGSGGGMSLFTTKRMSSTFSQNNTIHLIKCVWKRNKAFVASALNLAPEVYDRLNSGLLPTPIIDNCTFDSNINSNNNINSGDRFHAIEPGLAAVYISGYQVKFKHDIFFINNVGTGLYLSLASVHLQEGSKLYMQGNHGKNGGGIAIMAFSALFVHDGSSLTFVNNTSDCKGGAMFVHSIGNQHEAHFSHSCFIQYPDELQNVTFSFTNNIAKSRVGNTIFATSFAPCKHDHHLQRLLQDIGNRSELNVASTPTNFSFNPQSVDQIIPGKEIVLDILATGEEGEEYKNIVYEAFMTDTGSTESGIEIDPAYAQVSNNTIKFIGEKTTSPGILSLGTDTLTLKINISLSECPPGFLNNGKSCKCSKYEGIVNCEDFNAIIMRGFWMGKCNGDEVCTAHCPSGYCSYSGQKDEIIKLPSNLKNLNSYLCDEYRHGILCSQCKNGTSTYYHSHTYKCRPNTHCKFGALFYLLSEILPLTIVFLFVTIFNISLTSGTVNSFVLFAQVSDSIDLSIQKSINFPDEAKALSHPYKLVYRMFNFDFFSLEPLSFCLWESATALDMMSVKFITITYALFLVFLTVCILNSWKCKLFCVWFRPQTLRTSLTHGMTTLVVICFSQCARVCFQILNQTQLLYLHHQETVVFYDGSLHPFHGEHLKYAIPALFFLAFLVLLPMVWLLLYPIVFKLLAKCHLSESKLSKFLSKLFPIELLDSFQGCFKDNCRHFAGLYFLYRLIPLILLSVISNNKTLYTLHSVLLLSMLTLHSIFQPYINCFHNTVDSAMFFNLLLVNLLTTYNYSFTFSNNYSLNGQSFTVTNIVYVQVVLMYLPLVYVLCFCAFTAYRKARQQFLYSGYFKISEDTDSENLPQLRDIAE